MIEWAMIFALGVLAASLLWLLAVPVLSRRALRLATERLARRLPVSMAEVNAERDQLRAAQAVEVRRLEQAQEVSAARVATLMSENGRQSARIVGLEQQEAELRARVEHLQGELSTTTLAMYEAQGTLGTQVLLLHDALGLAERRGDLLRATEARLGAAQAALDEGRATIAGLETRATGQDLRLRSALAQVVALTDELGAANGLVNTLTAERDAARADAHLQATKRDVGQASVDVLTTDLARLRGELDDARRAASQTDQRFQLQAETIGGLADRIMAQDNELAAMHRLLEEAHVRRDALQSERARLLAERGPAAGVGVPAGDVSLNEEAADREARLRSAVAALGAELVAFALQPRTERPAPAGEGDEGVDPPASTA